MATAEQLKSLIRSHFSDDSERFYTITLQLAAHEARQGHKALAHDLKMIVEKERNNKGPRIYSFPKNLQGLVLTESPETPRSSFVLSSLLSERIDRIILEYRQQNKLKSYGLFHRRKLLLIGPPGTGKTMTAKVLSQELHLPLHTVQVDRLMTKFMGETSLKLRQIFELIKEEHAIYLFDEFDAIGGDRSRDNDVGEIRRVLNSFLQFIEQDSSDSLIIAATNNPKLLDHALFRRFDDVLHYENPGEIQRKLLIENVLGRFKGSNFSWAKILKESYGLSYAEIDLACRDAIKSTILSEQKKINASKLLISIKERLSIHSEL